MDNNIQNNQGGSVTLDITKMNAEQLYIHLAELYQSSHSFMVGNLDLVRGDYYDKKFKEFEKLKNDNLKLRDELEKARKRERGLKEKALERENEIGEYKKLYGEYVSPFNILKELYINNQDKFYSELSILNPKTKLDFNKKAIEHWLGVFQDLKLIKLVDRGRYIALMSYREANSVLYKSML